MIRKGRWKSGYACRCWRRQCRLYGCRQFRAKHPDHYQRRHMAQCIACKQHLSVDRYRTSGAEGKRERCKCHGYHFPHRRGSLFCVAGVAGVAGFVYQGPASAAEFYSTTAPLP